ncbi:MAG: hypothetical protein Q9191_006170 [Dirinaria sp. TL-2023a]
MNDSVEVNTTIIAACIPTLKPVYRVMTGKPGAEVYTRRYKESRRTPSSRRERFTELRDMEYVASQGLAHDESATLKSYLASLAILFTIQQCHVGIEVVAQPI